MGVFAIEVLATAPDLVILLVAMVATLAIFVNALLVVLVAAMVAVIVPLGVSSNVPVVVAITPALVILVVAMLAASIFPVIVVTTPVPIVLLVAALVSAAQTINMVSSRLVLVVFGDFLTGFLSLAALSLVATHVDIDHVVFLPETDGGSFALMSRALRAIVAPTVGNEDVMFPVGDISSVLYGRAGPWGGSLAALG